MLGLELLGIDDPHGKDRKRLVTYVEIDRCMTDAVGVVTGCRLGKRALKFRDWGKVAATFVDMEWAKRFASPPRKLQRVGATDASEIQSKNQQQMLAYREIQRNDLFAVQWVKVSVPHQELPATRVSACVLADCGEGINFSAKFERMRILCHACAGERYYEPDNS